MNKKLQSLHKKFGRLRAEANDVRKLSLCSRDATYRHFAALYFWWLPAEKAGVLVDLYKKHKIQFKQPAGNRINFVPLLKLVWDKKIETSFADRWSRALNEIHAEVQGSPDHYKKDGVAKLAHWIDTKGGPSMLSGYFSQPDTGDQAQQPIQQASEGLSDQTVNELLLAEAKQWFSSPATFMAGSTPSLPIKTKDFSLGLFHNDGAATHYLGHWLRPAASKEALIDMYRNKFEALPLQLRFIAELVHMRNVPWSLAKVAEKVRKSSLGGSEWRDLYALRSSTNDIQVSPTKGASGVVLTASLPMSFVAPFANDLFLARYGVVAMERKLLLPRIFNLVTQYLTQGFQTVQQQNVATQYLRLSWKEPLLNRAVDFYPFLQLPIIHLYPFYQGVAKAKDQVQCHGFKGRPTFQHAVSPYWVQKINVEFFDEWVTKYGAKASRPTNLTLGVTLDAMGIRIDFEYFDSTGFDNHVMVDFETQGVGQASLIVRSTDFAFALCQIADLALISDLRIEASADLICLRFSTAAAENYTCWIPACNRDGVRSAIGFSKYVHQVTPETVDDALDDDIP